MKAYVITLAHSQYSKESADRCIKSAKEIGGIDVAKYSAVGKMASEEVAEYEGLKWTWAGNNDKSFTDPKTGLKHFPYKTDDIRKKIGCFMSHYFLWQKCVEDNEDYLILEHDAVFVHPLPSIISFKGICMINDPTGATPRGRQWADTMKKRGDGVHKKTIIFNDGRPDGLAGNSAYIVKPWACKELINKTKEVGMWPNDAIMCRQLFPYLEEYYPFITVVRQGKSTTV